MVITTDETCDRCGNDMIAITVCHCRCPNCGAEYDCSDKGTTWWTIKRFWSLKTYMIL